VPASPAYADGPHVIRGFKRVGLDQTSHLGFALCERVRRDRELTGCSAYFIRRLASETMAEHFSRGGKSFLRLREVLEHRTLAGAEVGRHLWNVAKGYRTVGLTLARRASEMFRPRYVLAFRTVLETTPRPDSRVTLAPARDRMGVPCVRGLAHQRQRSPRARAASAGGSRGDRKQGTRDPGRGSGHR
jgi:hypothetical protein